MFSHSHVQACQCAIFRFSRPQAEDITTNVETIVFGNDGPSVFQRQIALTPSNFIEVDPNNYRELLQAAIGCIDSRIQELQNNGPRLTESTPSRFQCFVSLLNMILAFFSLRVWRTRDTGNWHDHANALNMVSSIKNRLQKNYQKARENATVDPVKLFTGMRYNDDGSLYMRKDWTVNDAGDTIYTFNPVEVPYEIAKLISTFALPLLTISEKDIVLCYQWGSIAKSKGGRPFEKVHMATELYFSRIGKSVPIVDTAIGEVIADHHHWRCMHDEGLALFPSLKKQRGKKPGGVLLRAPFASSWGFKFSTPYGPYALSWRDTEGM
jgi:hypothetical protein